MEHNLQIITPKARIYGFGLLMLSCLAVLLISSSVGAINKIPNPDPIPGSFGLEATKPQPPPTTGAHITTPSNGAAFTKSPIDVNGICPKGLLVQIYDNGVMVGAVMCTNGSFHVKVTLFAGTNSLNALVYDDLGQEGPKSNTVKVTYTNAHFTAFGELITLTSDYGRRSAGVGSALDWPLKLSGGTGPYAFSIDWGDGGAPDLKSQASPGNLTISHVYKNAGIYIVNIRVTDKNGVSAFLQVIAVANGAPSKAATTGGKSDKTGTVVRTKILWIPSLIALLLVPTSYWLGGRGKLVYLRNKMAKERDAYEKQ